MKKKRVLIVDDSKVINRAISKKLIKFGYICKSSLTLEDSLHKLKIEDFDYIVLDLNLPDSFGEELVDTIKQHSKAKIIVLTVETDTTLREALFSKGIFDFIVKNKHLLVSIENLHNSIKSMHNNKNNTILTIDDSRFIRQKIEKILKVRDYNILVAADAKEGLKILEENSINTIILDMELPDISGLDFLRDIKNKDKYKSIPVIILSGSNDAELIRDSLKLGALDFIHKPFNTEEFVLKADRAIVSENTRKELEEMRFSLEKKVKSEISKSKEKDRLMHIQARNAQMGEMINMIAHQWRQPLSAISATSSEIEIRSRLHKLDEKKAIDLAEKISDYSQHLSLTIDDFRNFFKESKEKNETNFDDIVRSVKNIIEMSLIEKKIELVENLNCSDIFKSYPSELKQVILNFIKNAEDVLVEKEIQNPKIEIRTYKKDNDLILEVADNGGGVPKEIMDKIFDPYFSTKTTRGGTGLGLYMSKTIIEEHCGGKLLLRNDEKGAIFSIVLKKNS